MTVPTAVTSQSGRNDSPKTSSSRSCQCRFSRVDGVTSILEETIGERTTVQSFVDTEYGGLDHYWEYTGTLFRSHYAHESPETIEEVRKLAADDDIAVLEPGGFDNTYELVTTDSFASEHGLETLTDLAEKFGDSDVRFGLGDEFVHRIDGWRGFVDAYDVDADRANEITSDAEVVLAGSTYDLRGREVDVVMGFRRIPNSAVPIWSPSRTIGRSSPPTTRWRSFTSRRSRPSRRSKRR
ncbi:hypothetical protein D8S78_13235 [Natrialba swarupiae]|nr:hypothetical protein [Natrialba swarupiae]